MPLHDWSRLGNWETFHHLWITELYYAVKQRLPAGFRAYMATVPLLGVGGSSGKPDVSVHQGPGEAVPPEAHAGDGNGAAVGSEDAPMFEVTVATLQRCPTLFVESRGFLIAALELVSPGNKDRPDAREASSNRYAGYLLQGVHLMLVDVHPRPLGFSYPDRIAAELNFAQPPCPAPCAVSYRVGEQAAGAGRFLAVWHRPLVVGAPLPSMVLPLNVYQSVTVDLEQTYARAAAGAYLQ
jgi:hypothetical protein